MLLAHAHTQCSNLNVLRYLQVLRAASKRPLVSSSFCIKHIKVILGPKQPSLVEVVLKFEVEVDQNSGQTCCIVDTSH